jgi:tRNA(fMet)-specific endonuclease VapC
VIYTLDSNACISHLRTRGVSSVSRRLSAASAADVMITSIVVAELLYGAFRSRDAAKNLAEVKAFLSPFASTPFDDDAASHYAEIRNDLARLGTPIGPNDLMIAATARARNLTLVTHNTAEFSRVSGLKIDDWENQP